MDIVLDSIDAAAQKTWMTPETCRAGRALIGLSQTELAQRVGVTPLAIRNYEAGKSDPAFSRWLTIKRVLEQAGVMFLDGDRETGPGVRLRKPTAPPLAPEAPSQDT